MKIQNSSVTMASSHKETSFSYKESATVEVAKSNGALGAILTLSKEALGRSMTASVAAYKDAEEREAQRRQEENQARSVRQLADKLTRRTENSFEIPDEIDIKIKMLRRILAALRGEKIPEDCDIRPKKKDGITDLRSREYREMDETFYGASAENVISISRLPAGIGTGSTGSTWQKITAVSGYAVEAESTTFASKGLVSTADGRTIDFNIEVSMSRAVMSRFDMLDVEEYIKTDPLMINLDSNVASVSDQKFFFDLDSDGDAEEISFAGKGSGFLALDKNGDGKINDGSELFGTKSGDGFRDLSMYDSDGNGWIDENDRIFDKLKVWTKDDKGRDILLSLKDADVGAIYLGNADTQFSLKNSENRLNAEIKKTGIYLKESTGLAGTLNHVDLVV